MSLQQIEYYSSEGLFRRIGWSRSKPHTLKVLEEIKPEELVFVPELCEANGNNMTAHQIANDLYKTILDNFPNVQLYRKIRFFWLPFYVATPQNHRFKERVMIGFYYRKE